MCQEALRIRGGMSDAPVMRQEDADTVRPRVRVRQLMQAEVLEAERDELLSEAAIRMRDHQVGSLMVLSGDELVGILSERDIVRAIAEGRSPSQEKLGEWMSHGPATIRPEVPADEAVLAVLQRDVRHLPVVEGRRVLGMISARDILVMGAWRLVRELAEEA